MSLPSGINLPILVVLLAAFAVLYLLRSRELDAAAAGRAQFAQMAGFTPIERQVPSRLGPFPMFTDDSAWVEQAHKGSLGRHPVVIGEFSLAARGDRRTLHFPLFLVVFTEPAPGVPDVELWPNVMGVPAPTLYTNYHDVGASEDFARACYVRAPNAAAVNAFLTPVRQVYLVEHRGWGMQMSQGRVMLFHRREEKPARLPLLLDEARRLYEELSLRAPSGSPP